MTKTNWQERIDTELGKPKWQNGLSEAIIQKAEEMNTSRKTPVFIPFISVAMVTILVFLTLSFYPNMQQNDQAALQNTKFQKIYYSKLPAREGMINAEANLAVVGMTQSTDAELLQELSVIYEQLKPIDPPQTTHAKSMSVILYDDVNIAYPYNIYRTFTDEIIFEEPSSYTFYKYSGEQTKQTFAILEKQFKLKPFLNAAAILVAIELLLPFVIRKYYAVPKRKETFDNITLNRIARLAPIPYIFYFNFKIAMGPTMLTWWEVVVPFLAYQIIVLLLMKQQKEPHPYIVERMLSFVFALAFLIAMMIML